jgi:hypothetical protein
VAKKELSSLCCFVSSLKLSGQKEYKHGEFRRVEKEEIRKGEISGWFKEEFEMT